jgi:hypothetical protein
LKQNGDAHEKGDGEEEYHAYIPTVVHLCPATLRLLAPPPDPSVQAVTAPESTAPRVLNPTEGPAPPGDADTGPKVDDGEPVILACIPALDVARFIELEGTQGWTRVWEGCVAMEGSELGGRVRYAQLRTPSYWSEN